MLRINFTALALFFALLLPSTARATDLRSPVVSGSPHTYLDLLKKIFTTVEIDPKSSSSATAADSVTIRPLTGNEQPFKLTGASRIEDVQRLDLRIGGNSRVLILFTARDEVDAGATEAALFDLSGQPRLLDIAEAPSFPDDHGWLSEKPILHLSDSTDAFVFYNEHHNSNQSYETYTPIFVDRGKLKVIGQFDVLSCIACQSGDFQEKVDITPVPALESKYANLKVRVTLEYKRPKRAPRAYTAELRWQPTKGGYVPVFTEFGRLMAFNSRNY